MQFDGSSVLEEPPLKPQHITDAPDWGVAQKYLRTSRQLVRSASSPASCVTSPSSPHAPGPVQCGSLVSNKYLIQEATDGNSLHSCTHVHTKQEYVCKVSQDIICLQKCQHCTFYLRRTNLYVH